MGTLVWPRSDLLVLPHGQHFCSFATWDAAGLWAPVAANCPFEVLGCQMTAGAVSRARARRQSERGRSSGSCSSQRDQRPSGTKGRRGGVCGLSGRVVKGCWGECDRLVRRNCATSYASSPPHHTLVHTERLEQDDVQLKNEERQFCVTLRF